MIKQSKQSKLLSIKTKILSNLFNEKYGLELGEFNSTAGTEKVKLSIISIGHLHDDFVLLQLPNCSNFYPILENNRTDTTNYFTKGNRQSILVVVVFVLLHC